MPKISTLVDISNISFDKLIIHRNYIGIYHQILNDTNIPNFELPKVINFFDSLQLPEKEYILPIAQHVLFLIQKGEFKRLPLSLSTNDILVKYLSPIEKSMYMYENRGIDHRYISIKYYKEFCKNERLSTFVRAGNLDIVGYILTETQQEIYPCILEDAFCSGSVEMVDYIRKIDREHNLNSYMFTIASYDHVDLLQYIYQLGCEINITGVFPDDFALWCCRFGSIKCLKFLIETLGLTFHQQNSIYLSTAMNGNRVNIVKYLTINNSKGKSKDIITFACNNDSLSLLLVISQRGVCTSDELLVYALRGGSYKILNYLFVPNNFRYLSQGAKIENLQELFDKHCSSLHVIKFLRSLDKSNIIDINHNDGKALIKSCRDGDYDLITYLIENGADITVCNNLPMKICKCNYYSSLGDIYNNRTVCYNNKYNSYDNNIKICNYLLHHSAKDYTWNEVNVLNSSFNPEQIPYAISKHKEELFNTTISPCTLM